MTQTSFPLSAQADLKQIDRYWRAANYLSVGQIYLMDNPLLREPLRPEHIKPRLPGHWGTTPGLNFIYAHLNRAICQRELDMIYICGPGHGLEWWPTPGLKAATARFIPISAKMPAECKNCSSSFLFPVAFPVTLRRKRRVLSTKGVN